MTLLYALEPRFWAESSRIGRLAKGLCLTASGKSMSTISASEDRWLVRSVHEDSDSSDPVLEVDLDISRPPMAWSGSRLPATSIETAFGPALGGAVKASGAWG